MGAVACLILGIALGALGLFAVSARYPLLRTHSEPTLSQQKTCADQAEKSFAEGDWQHGPNIINSYVSHYNPKLQKCFILEDVADFSALSTKGTTSHSQFLLDAFEGTPYGDFMDITTPRKPPDSQHFIVCKLTPPGVPEKTCRSEDEWKDFVANYMSD